MFKFSNDEESIKFSNDEESIYGLIEKAEKFIESHLKNYIQIIWQTLKKNKQRYARVGKCHTA